MSCCGVRDAPIAAFDDFLYYFGETQPELRRVRARGGDSALAARGEALKQVHALAVDRSRIIIGVVALTRARGRALSRPDRDGAA